MPPENAEEAKLGALKAIQEWMEEKI